METLGQQKQNLDKGEFLQTVFRVSPRVAAFDCDGTLWSSDAGETFLDWEIRSEVVPAEVGRAMRARYADYKAGNVSEDDMCAELVTMHNGLADVTVMAAATEFMEHVFPGKIFPEMRELVQRLTENGCEIWAVSSSNEWVIRAGVKQLGISEDRILAVRPVLEGGIVTDRVLRIPSGPGKAQALREVAQKPIDAAFGNSVWDAEMLSFARHPFVVNPRPEFELEARRQRWPIYFPDGTRRA
jgi:HAD superfamily phosphoserine phosphatase-like hydrolase